MRHMIVPTVALALLLSYSAPAQSGDYWSFLDGPPGGNISVLTQSSLGRHFALADNGIYYSADATRWTRAGGIPPTASFLSFTETRSGILLASTANMGVFRSSDGGLTWSDASEGLPSTFYHSIASNPAATEALVAGGSGVYRSTNDGGTWQYAGLSGGSARVIVFDPTGVAYAAAGFGVMRSEPGDRLTWSWTDSTVGSVGLLSLVLDTDGILWGANAYDGLFRSSDAGATWAVFPSYRNVATIRSTSAGEVLVGFSGGRIIGTLNSGTLWRELSDSVVNPTPNTIHRGTDGTLRAGTNKGVFEVPLAGTGPWAIASEGIVNSLLSGLLVTPSSPSSRIVATQYTGLVSTRSSGDSGWTTTDLRLRANVTANGMIRDSSGNLIIALSRGGLLRSTDGLNWAELVSEPQEWGTLTALAASGPWIYAGTRVGSVFRVRESDSILRTQAAPGSAYVNAVAARGDTVWIGTDSGLFRSIDAGVNYEQTGPSIRSYSIALSADGRIYVGSHTGRIYRSENGGETWTMTSVGNVVHQITALGVNSRGHVFAGSLLGGVFVSTDRGTTWTQRNTGLAAPGVTTITFDEQDYAYVGTPGGGVYRSSERTASVTPFVTIGEMDLR